MSPADNVTVEMQFEVEQFYFHEARLLDNRQYQQWLALLDQEIKYIMPSRVNVQVDNRMRGDEDMIAVSRELEGEDSDGCPLRGETIIHLGLRVERAYKVNSWAENPPARTRRIIGNVQIIEHSSNSYQVLSNFILNYAEPGSENFVYSGQRCDRLTKNNNSYLINRREIIMDYATINYPTLGLIF